jgi:hypothetical protein
MNGSRPRIIKSIVEKSKKETNESGTAFPMAGCDGKMGLTPVAFAAFSLADQEKHQ